MKRKRGKKFRYFDPEQNKKVESEENPFEKKSSQSKILKDREKRKELIEEYNNRGKNNAFIDKRLGQTSSKLNDEDK